MLPRCGVPRGTSAPAVTICKNLAFLGAALSLYGILSSKAEATPLLTAVIAALANCPEVSSSDLIHDLSTLPDRTLGCSLFEIQGSLCRFWVRRSYCYLHFFPDYIPAALPRSYYNAFSYNCTAILSICNDLNLFSDNTRAI
jgi:hypothetical protein